MSLPPRGWEIPREIQPTEEGATVGPNYLTIGASGGPGLHDHCHHRGNTIIRAGTYAKAQLLVGLNLTTPLPGRLFAPATRPTVPVRMSVIAGIPSSMPDVFAEKQVGSRTRDSSLSQDGDGPG